MEHPAEEWDREAARLGPVRLDIPWSAKGEKEPGGGISWILVFGLGLPMLAPFALDVVRTDGWGEFACVLAGTAVGTAVMLLMTRVYFSSRNQARRQVVTLQGAMLTLERHKSGERSVERYPVLEMHDLRLLPRFELYGEGIARDTMSRYSNGPWSSPERIAFTHGGRAYSFGGPVDDETAAHVLTAIIDYDARLRAALGMPAEPNITTYDAGRAAAAAGSGFDIDKGPFSF